MGRRTDAVSWKSLLCGGPEARPLSFPHGEEVLGGTFLHGEKHGHWEQRFGGGNVWEGSFARGEKHGHWVLRHADGSVSEDSYVNGKQHGHWANRYRDRSSSEGPYVYGREDGWGIDRYADGSCSRANVPKAKGWTRLHADGTLACSSKGAIKQRCRPGLEESGPARLG